MSRRYRAIHLNYPLLQEMFTTGWNNVENGYVVWCVDGLPKDAQLVRTFNDDRRGVAVLIFEHESFDEVSLGDEIPQVIPGYRLEPLEDKITEIVQRVNAKFTDDMAESLTKRIAKVMAR